MAIALFLTTVVGFFSFVGIQEAQDQMTEDTQILITRLKEDSIFADGMFSESEEARLVEMNCSEIKEMFSSKIDLCIYLRDSSRNIIPLSNNNETIKKYGVGCSGIKLSGKSCGKNVTT